MGGAPPDVTLAAVRCVGVVCESDVLQSAIPPACADRCRGAAAGGACACDVLHSSAALARGMCRGALGVVRAMVVQSDAAVICANPVLSASPTLGTQYSAWQSGLVQRLMLLLQARLRCGIAWRSAARRRAASAMAECRAAAPRTAALRH